MAGTELTQRQIENLLSKISVGDGCWEWLGTRQRLGYGMFSVGPRMHMAYRVLYEFLCRKLDPSETLDHLCRNPGCVRPDHLEPVTHRENVLRGVGPTAENARKTHCLRGHIFDFIRPDGGRGCRTCKNWKSRIYKAKKRAQA